MKVRTRSVEETRSLAEHLGRDLLRPGDVVVLAGALGAGKTAFAQGVARGLDVSDPVVSPTFMIMREYEGRLPLAHIDVYRLDRFQELHDLGFDELLEDRVTLVEWGDVAEPLLPADRLEVRLVATGDEEREITVAGHGETWVSRSRRLAEVLGGSGVGPPRRRDEPPGEEP